MRVSFLRHGLPVVFLLLTWVDAWCQVPTWSEDIAPLIYNNCSHCHHPGQVAPFSLLSYADATENALSIYTAMYTGHMPPWPADPDYRSFVGETVVTDEEVAQVLGWLEAGMPYGDPALEPEAPQFEPTGTLLENVDFIAAIEPYTLQTDAEEYRWFVVPTDFAETKYIQAIEVVAGLPEAVHHADIHIDTSGISAAHDAADPLPGFNGETGMLNSTQYINAWQPGAGPARFPDDWGIALPPGADLVIEIHYGPGYAESIDETFMRLEFVDDIAAVRPVRVGWLMSSGHMTNGPLVIPPNEVSTFYQEATPFWSDKSLIAICPHMHLLGKSYKVWMETLEGESIPLIDIPEWNFHWQFYYTFEHVQPMPSGAALKSVVEYDNTAQNPFNPFSPPQTVSDGPLTVDEMILCYFIYADYQPGDEDISLGPALGLDETKQGLALEVFPNPASEVLSVRLPSEVRDGLLTVHDVTGKSLFAGRTSGDFSLDVSAWATGTYTVDFIADRTRWQAVFVKE